ncbi:DNA mismatch repair protein [Rhizoclosmatium hyalinum]|nr:DNA mismatch repair protein [Rhizoclosmatium hyalinum]
MSISRLSSDSVSRLRVGLFAVSLAQVASELVQNAVDSKPGHVEILVNISERSVEVRDDGCGIEPDDFALLGQSVIKYRCRIVNANHEQVRTFANIFFGGKTLHCGIASNSRKPGTTVTVKDLFFNIPARQSQVLKETIDTIRKHLEPIFLISNGIKFTMTDLSTGKRILTLKPTESYLDSFTQLNGLGFGTHASVVEWSTHSIKIEGFMSTLPYGTKAFQYCFINKHLLSSQDNQLYTTINNVFSSSKLTKQESMRLTSTSSPQKHNQTISAYPVFLINISCGASLYDLTLDAEKKIVMFKNVAEVVSSLEQCTSDFLNRNKLLSRDAHVSSATYSADSGSEEGEVFEGKSSGRLYQPPPAYFRFLQSVKASTKRNLNWDDSVFGNSAVKGDAEALGSFDSTKQASLVNVFQNGPVYSNPKTRKHSSTRPKQQQLRKSQDPSIHAKQFDTAPINQILNTWQNPIFQPPLPHQPQQDSEYNITVTPITKSNLQQLRVIGQVDRKFIAGWFPLPTPQSSTTSLHLVIIDQHAADERVKLENLFIQTFGSQHRHTSISETTSLSPPINLSLEPSSVLRYQQGFARWGIQVGAPDEVDGCVQVHALPSTIVNRCVADPELVKALVVEHVLHLDEAVCGGGGMSMDAVVSSVGCPKGVFHLLNSKACRSAIMFGDELDMAVCETLVGNLKTCQHPFQCAHGRPSMTLVSTLVAPKHHQSLPFQKYPLTNLYKMFKTQ